jgi:hypothetical protein
MDSSELLELPEIKRLSGMLNLLSHPHPIISEQISILLANVSNSPFFRYEFISDRCIKSIIKILRFNSKEVQTEVSLLAIMIGILNLSANCDIVDGIDNMQFFNSLQTIIEEEHKPPENLAIGLMAISNIFTLCPTKVDIQHYTEQFAERVLTSWKQMMQEEKAHPEVIKNLVYASLILFYNILLHR